MFRTQYGKQIQKTKICDAAFFHVFVNALFKKPSHLQNILVDRFVELFNPASDLNLSVRIGRLKSKSRK